MEYKDNVNTRTSMNCTYSVFKKRKRTPFKIINNAACFIYIFVNYEKYIGKVKVLIKTSEHVIEYKDWWLNLVIELAGKRNAKIVKKGNKEYFVLKPKNMFHLKMILTILRFMWEEDNHYEKIVPITKAILDEYPNTDKLVAVTVANSVNNWYGGHSLIEGFGSKLYTINQINRKSKRFTQLFCLFYNNLSWEKTLKAREEMLEKRKDSFDFQPMIDWYINHNKKYKELFKK